MKPRHLLWIPVLAATHALVYFTSGGGGMAAPAEAAAVPATGNLVAAKTAERKRAGGRQALLQELAELNLKGLPEEEFETARQKLLAEWLRDDPEATLGLLFSPEGFGRFENLIRHSSLNGEIDEAMLRQPLEVWKWIRDGRYGSNRAQVTMRWVQAMEHEDRRDLMALAVLEGNEEEQSHGVSSWCIRADAGELAKMREWLDGVLLASKSHDWALETYARQQVELGEGDLTKTFGEEKDPAIRKALCAAWVEQECEDMPADYVVARLAELPPDLRADAMEKLSSMGYRDGMAGLARFLEESGRKGFWEGLANDRKEELVDEMVSNARNNYSDPEEMFGQLAGISAADLGELALKKAGETWSENDESGGRLEVLEALPAGAKRNAFIAGVLVNLDAGDEDFAKVLDLISDEELKGRLKEGTETGEE